MGFLQAVPITVALKRRRRILLFSNPLELLEGIYWRNLLEELLEVNLLEEPMKPI